MTQTELFQIETVQNGHYPISVTPEISTALSAGAVVAFSVSGGKDSIASAHATTQYLDSIGHAGPRLLIHADLGRSEWSASLPMCEILANRLGLELVVVRRTKGDMLDRWRQRHSDNIARYINLSCVTLIGPWATPGMRFCTSEMKVAPIVRELSERFPGREIISVVGIRKAESPDRAKSPTSACWGKAPRKVSGLNWHPIDQWSTPDVFRYIEERALPLHPAYTLWGSTRVSCTGCILQSSGDSKASARCPENVPYLLDIVNLEIESGFSFKQSGWLADEMPEILTEHQLFLIKEAKIKAERRRLIESVIPKRLLYEKGWPTGMPTMEDACLLADCRNSIRELMGYPTKYTTAIGVIGRYRTLLTEKASRDARTLARSNVANRRKKPD